MSLFSIRGYRGPVREVNFYCTRTLTHASLHTVAVEPEVPRPQPPPSSSLLYSPVFRSSGYWRPPPGSAATSPLPTTRARGRANEGGPARSRECDSPLSLDGPSPPPQSGCDSGGDGLGGGGGSQSKGVFGRAQAVGVAARAQVMTPVASDYCSACRGAEPGGGRPRAGALSVDSKPGEVESWTLQVPADAPFRRAFSDVFVFIDRGGNRDSFSLVMFLTFTIHGSVLE